MNPTSGEWRGRCACLGLAVSTILLGSVVAARASEQTATNDSSRFSKPVNLSLQPPTDDAQSVYAPPMPPLEDEGVNQGAVSFDLSIGYVTDYVFRGFEIFDNVLGAEDRVNLQIESHLSFDLGKLPHPFIGVFVNYADSDEISSFEEIRPTLGAVWTIRPIILSAGHNTYLYPDRSDVLETSEVWGKVELDDSYFLRTDRPLLSPYAFFAYDYDRYGGWYFELGVNHDFVIEDTGITLTAHAEVAYVQGIQLFQTVADQHNVDGFQHYQIGLLGNYSLNTLFNLPLRYGEWSVQGFVNYTDGIDDDLAATSQIWGGMGILFKY